MPNAPTPTRTYTASELARLLEVSRQAVAQWKAEGCPSVDGTQFRLAEVVRWRIARAEETAREAFSSAEARELWERGRADKIVAEARIAELELAKLQGDLITLDDALRETETIFDQLRGKIVALPAKSAYRFLGLRRMPEATKVLREVADDLLETLVTALAEPDEASDDLGEVVDAGRALVVTRDVAEAMRATVESQLAEILTTLPTTAAASLLGAPTAEEAEARLGQLIDDLLPRLKAATRAVIADTTPEAA